MFKALAGSDDSSQGGDQPTNEVAIDGATRLTYLSTLLLALLLSTGSRSFAQQAASTDTRDVPAQASKDSAAADALASIPIAGSQLPREGIRCAACHTESALWEGEKLKLFISPEVLDRDIHWQNGVACSDCHGGDPASLNYAEAHVGLTPANQIRERCAHCHKEQHLGLIKGVHAKAGDKDERGRGSPLACVKCHGSNAHEIFPAKDERSPVYLNNQVRTCGSCHAEDQATYGNTVHGRGLYRSGLKVTAVCADCHGSHGIYYAADGRSTLHPANVAATCSKCHSLIDGRLEHSVHSRAHSASTDVSAQSKLHRKPACTDCHFGHPLLSADLADFRLPIDDNCGNCHADLYSRYARKMHSTLTDHGYTAAAHCVDCHGSHDILHVNDPHSRLAPGDNRLKTCQKCHTQAVSNFAEFNPHANFKDEARYPRLHAVYTGMRYSVNIILAFFLIHSLLWYIRAFVDRMQHGGHTPLASKQFALPRFEPMQRVLYGALLVAFLGLTFTGLTLKYGNQSWGQQLAQRVGGFRTLSAWHQFFAMIAIVVFVIYVVRAVGQIIRLRRDKGWHAVALGPDSLVPNGRDFRDVFKMLSWFIGFGRKPGFERWAYWEKLDYWAFILAATLIGFSGLASWFPNVFCLVLSGSILNIAKMIHSEFALYIASFLFLIHFFHAHLRAEKFPMDLSVITGLVSEDHLRTHRPDYIARLEREGKLGDMRQPPPSGRSLWLDIAAVVFIFTLGLWLLAVTILASLEE